MKRKESIVNENTKRFCEIVKKSSDENEKSIKILFERQLYKNCMAILRQEIELYIKTLFLSMLEPDEREILMEAFLENKPWNKQKMMGKNLTDRFMLEQIKKFPFNYGWEEISYKFGCSFIHFSVLHDLDNENITSYISEEDKINIVKYINQYHHGNLNSDFCFDDVKPYILDIFIKIKENMVFYLGQLNE